MKETTRERFTTDVQVNRNEVSIRRPFSMRSENRRRYVRLEVSSPMWLKRLKDVFGNFWPDGGGPVLEATILNISPGGILVELGEPVNEGDIVSMSFMLQGVERLDSVLGMVKRSESDDGAYLAGIEFISRRFLADILSQGEMEMLSEDHATFQESVEAVLNKYLYVQGSVEA